MSGSDMSRQVGGGLRAAAVRLERLGRADLQAELRAAVVAAARPLPEAAARSAARVLPQRGGLARRVAMGDIRTTARMSTRRSGVRIVAVPAAHGAAAGVADPAAINRGVVRHPFWGRWPSGLHQAHEGELQHVRAGWFTDPIREHRDEVRAQIATAVHDVTMRALRGAA